MKKNLIKLAVAALSLALLLIPISVGAADSFIKLKGFSFDLNTDGEAVIHSYDDRSAKLVIPDRLLNYYIGVIDDFAFFNDTVITSVSFENSVSLKHIGTNAFYGCSKLSSLDIPSSVNELGFGAFQSCTGLKSVNIDEGITTLSQQLFYGCSSLKSVSIPKSVTTIEKLAFGGCSSLESLVLTETVTDIAPDAFSGCDKLKIICYKDTYAYNYAVENNIPYELFDVYELGDANRDGNIDIMDVTLIQKSLIGKTEIKPYAGVQLADANGDGNVTLRDATLIQMKIAGIISQF